MSGLKERLSKFDVSLDDTRRRRKAVRADQKWQRRIQRAYPDLWRELNTGDVYDKPIGPTYMVRNARYMKAMRALDDAIKSAPKDIRPKIKRTAKSILKAVASETGVSVHDIKGPLRKKTFFQARHQVCYLLRREGWSYPRIGTLLGRDHTTIMHAVRKYAADHDLEVPTMESGGGQPYRGHKGQQAEQQ